MTKGLRYRYGQHAARSTDEYVFHQLLPYLGNKRNLLELIDDAVRLLVPQIEREPGHKPLRLRRGV